MRIYVVGGTFDNEGGKASGLVYKIAMGLERYEKNVEVYNGGYYAQLNTLIQDVLPSKRPTVVLWWPSVPNDLDKVCDVKAVCPQLTLVTSKHNAGQQYPFMSLVQRSLEQHANLTVEFDPEDRLDEQMVMRLFDPLGNVWYSGYSVDELTATMFLRLSVLCTVTRYRSTSVGPAIGVPNDTEFFEYVRECADEFHRLIAPGPDVARFLGNSSFRCQRGFPSMLTDKGVFVSQRNIDKRCIEPENFVAVSLSKAGYSVEYLGDTKPSVDTAMQLSLYRAMPKIKYMIHGHCYVKDGVWTQNALPCGAFEEADEVMKAIAMAYGSFRGENYAVNLLGHGCMLMASSVKKLRAFQFVKRTVPEYLGQRIERGRIVSYGTRAQEGCHE